MHAPICALPPNTRSSVNSSSVAECRIPLGPFGLWNWCSQGTTLLSQRALQQPLWPVWSAVLTVNSTGSCCDLCVCDVAVIWYVGVLISIAAVTNYHKFRDLKQHPWFISQFCGSEAQGWLGSVSSLTKLKSRSWWGRNSSWRFWGWVNSHFTHVVG